MDSSVDLIEVLSDGKYRLNEYELQSIVSKAEECNDFAVISIIGAKNSGKTKFMNSLVKYLECEDKKSWPKDCVIQYKSGFKNRSKKKPVIQMWSKPFILEENGQKTAVFLIDTSHVIQSMVLSVKVAQDLIGLLFAISSTLVYNQRNTMIRMSQMTEIAQNVIQFVENCYSFQELFYLINGWELTLDLEEKGYSLGIEGGQRYVQDQTQYSELNKYFKNIECCLLPPAGEAVHKFDLEFNYLNREFVVQISELIKYRLLNISEMQVKRHPVSQRALRPQELVVLLQSYVNKLNGDSLPIDFGPIYDFNEEEVSESSYGTPNGLEMDSLPLQVLQNLLSQKQNELNEYMNGMKSTTEEILEINKAIINHNTYHGHLDKLDLKDNKNRNDEDSDDIVFSGDSMDLSVIDSDFILNQNKGKIDDKTEEHEKNFSENQMFIHTESGSTQTTAKMSSFAIHFSRYNLFAGNYDKELRTVLDKFGNRCRPNCITFSDEFLFGSEAINHIQIKGNTIMNPYFDFMYLLSMRYGLTEEELNSCPLPLIINNNVLRVKVEDKFNNEFNIESIFALKVLNIKRDAEKQLENTITRAVFTVPTYYSIKERNVFRDVATIAGLESVHILSEITAAAIGYSYEVKPQKEINVLFVAINDYECDAAVCRLKINQIEYLSYFAVNLDAQQNKKFRNLFNKTLKKFLQNMKIIKRFDDILLFGDSEIAADIKRCLSLYFVGQVVNDQTNGSNIVVNGSAIFCKSIYENNADLRFDIKEVVFHSLHYRIEKRQNRSKILINSNTKLPWHKTIDFGIISKKKFQSAISIEILKDSVVLAKFKPSNRLPVNYNQANYSDFVLHFNINSFGELTLSLKLTAKYGVNDFKIDLVPIKLGLSRKDLKRDKKFIKLSNESTIESQTKLILEKSRKDLEDRYLQIMKRFNNSTNLEPIKSKKIKEQLKKIEALLSSNDTELKTLTNQISLLEVTIDLI